MSAQHPNHFKLQRGEVSNGGDFGSPLRVDPICVTEGLGHQPHLQARFDGGLRMDWTPQALVAFIRQAQEALAQLPLQFQATADYVGGEDA